MTLTDKPGPYGYSIEALQLLTAETELIWYHRSYRTVVVNPLSIQKEFSLKENLLETMLIRQRWRALDELHEQYRALFKLLATDGPKEPLSLIACNDIVRDAVVDLEAEQLLTTGKSWLQVKELLSLTKKRRDIGPLRFTVAVKSVNGRLVDQFNHKFYCNVTNITANEVKQHFYPLAWNAVVERHINYRLDRHVRKLHHIEDPDFTFDVEVSKWDLARYAILHYRWR